MTTAALTFDDMEVCEHDAAPSGVCPHQFGYVDVFEPAGQSWAAAYAGEQFSSALSWLEAEPRGELFFEELALQNPQHLLAMLDSLCDAELSFAAEAIGRVTDERVAIQTLAPLLSHASAVVREGAVYGLQRVSADDEDIRLLLQAIAAHDPSPGVRDAANEAIAA